VRAKKTKPRSGPIEYLLSLDSKLQKLSLRRISRPKKSQARSQRPQRKPALAGARTTWHQAVVFGGVAVLAAAALITARQPSAPVEMASLGDDVVLPARVTPSTPLAKPAPPPEVTPAPARVERPVTETSTPARVTTPAAPMRAETSAPVRAEVPVATSRVVTSQANNPPSSSTLPAASVVPPAPAPVAASPSSSVALSGEHTAEPTSATPATIFGCLERDADSFRLTDVSGADAPKVRSWKSGFFRKRSTSVELVTDRSAVSLTDYVGQRVSATGALEDRELRVRSIHTTGPCD